MTHVTFNKVVTVSKEVRKGLTSVGQYKYKEAEKALLNETEIQVSYIFADHKRRNNLLEKLGFKLKETLWFNDELPYSPIEQVWSR